MASHKSKEDSSGKKDKVDDHKHSRSMLRYPPVSMEADSVKPFQTIALTLLLFFPIALATHWHYETNNYQGVATYTRDFSTKNRAVEGIFLLGYMILTFYWRVQETAHNARFYEVLWGCNIAILLTSLGCFLRKPLLISSGVMIVGLDQLLWYVECTTYLTIGKFPLGVASYIVWPQTSLARKVTTLHHLWFLPFGFYCLRGSYFHPFAFEIAALLNSLLVVLARAFTPCNVWFPITPTMKDVIESGRKKHCIVDKNKTHYMDYMNINTCYEFWSDVPIKFFHLCNEKPFYIYIPFIVIVMNSIQYLPFLFLLKLSSFCFGK